jgi:hypothetical protein
MVGRWGGRCGNFTNPGCLAGIGKLPAPALGGWYFGWYYWYFTFWREPSFDFGGNSVFEEFGGNSTMCLTYITCLKYLFQCAVMYCTLSMEVKSKTNSHHNQKTDTTAQPEKKFLQPTRSKSIYLSLLPTWEFDDVIKNSTGRAMWDLIYMDRQTDRQIDRWLSYSPSLKLLQSP